MREGAEGPAPKPAYGRVLVKLSGEALMGSQPVGQLITEKDAKIGEHIQVRRFVRFTLGEGIEKRQDDFAAEVMAQASRG